MNIADLHATISVSISGEKSIKSLMGDLEKINGSFRELVGVNDQARKRFSSLGGVIRSTGGFLTKFSGGLDNLKKTTGLYLTAIKRLIAPLTAVVKDALGKGRDITGFRLATGFSEGDTDFVQRLSRITSRFANPIRREDAQQLFESLAGQLNQAQVSGQLNPYLAALGVNPYSTAREAFQAIASNIIADRFSDRQLSAILQNAGLPTQLKQFRAFSSVSDLDRSIDQASPYLTSRDVASSDWFRSQWNRGRDFLSMAMGRVGGRILTATRDLINYVSGRRDDGPLGQGEAQRPVVQNNSITINSTAPAGELRAEFDRQSAAYLFRLINEENPKSYLSP